MSDFVKKRFWKEVTVEARDTGFVVLLDGKAIKTPAKTLIEIPSKPLAQAVAAEWKAVEGKINPETMPMTRRANAAIDKVAPQKQAVSEMLAAYGESDLLVYRATYPDELIARQNSVWGSYLDWAERRFDLAFRVTKGVMPVAQSEGLARRLAEEVDRLSPFQLTGFHDLVTLSGSLVLGLAAISDDHDLEAIWQAAALDELWQVEQWGEDEDATRILALKQQDFRDAHRFFCLADGT